MIIDPYKIFEKKENDNVVESKESFNMNNLVLEIINFLIQNHMDLLEKQNTLNISKKIEEYILIKSIKVSNGEISNILNEVISKIFGYGILDKYINDNITTDIRVIKHNLVYIKQLGKWKRTNLSFKNNNEYEEFVRYIVLKNNSNINNENPIVVVSDRKKLLRIEAGIYPCNIIAPSLAIRIHKQNEEKTLEILLMKDEMLDLLMYDFLIKAIYNKKSIVICGKGGSGKTTLLRALLNKLPEEIAITANEETAELNIKDRNIIQREIVIRKDENKTIDLEKLLRHSLVMSNDVLVLGEMKGKEASVFFDAISTGHIGYATVHASSVMNTIDRIIVLIKKDIKAQNYTEDFLKSFLSSSIDYIIYMDNYKIQEIAEIEYDTKLKEVKFSRVFVKSAEKEKIK